MESIRIHDTSTTDQNGFELPSLFKFMESNSVSGFDNSPDKSHAETSQGQPNIATTSCLSKSSMENMEPGRLHSVSISMPPSPALKNMAKTKRVLFSDRQEEEANLSSSTTGIPCVEGDQKPKQVKFFSQPMPVGNQHAQGGKKNFAYNSQEQNQSTRAIRLHDKQFDSFKTWSGKLERQMSNLVGKPQEKEQEINLPRPTSNEAVPVDRYFDALEGPELEILRASEEELVLPKDKPWPFLLRFPISAFGICLGISSQAILWKTLASSSSSEFLHISPDVNYVLWCIGIAATVIVSIIYSLKIILFFEGVRREYYHPIRVNFFFAPWITSMFLLLGLPTQISKTIPHFIWYLLMAPILALELKIYGQWMSGGQRRLSKVANPSNHLSIVGNFVGALLGASMGLKEGPIFFYAVGVAHYIVLFVTLYQRLPTNETLPKELHPVFFLFVAAPSVASMAWARLQGSFDYGSRICYFVALFLYASLAVRVNFFRGFKFSLAWWAYTFPMTGAAIATIRYANEVQSPLTKVMLVALSAIATLIVSALFLSTLVHAFVLGDLFPNDIAIAISHRRPKASRRRRSHQRSESADAKDVEAAVNGATFTF